MNRRRFIQVTGASAAYSLGSRTWEAPGQTPGLSTSARGCLIYADRRLGELGESFVQRTLSAANTNRLIAALSSGAPISQLDTSAVQHQVTDRLAFNHLILLALADDPLLVQAWQREATISPGAIYAFGFGAFRGSLGYIESDRNPFLHAAHIARAPFETQLITITGTDTTGIAVAADAFLQKGLVNGLVAGTGQWNRSSATLLDRDPLPPSFTSPTAISSTMGQLTQIAVTQASEDEYRGVLADTGVEPVWIWRTKYYEAGQWDGAGEVASFRNYAAGLHRRAYGNTVWAAGFVDTNAASRSANFIARAAGLSPAGLRWTGKLPPYAWGLPAMGDGPQTGTLELWIEDRSVMMASRTMAL